MEVINYESYVSLEVAKLLKDVGFNLETFSHWAESDINNPDFKFSGLSDKPILYDGYIPISEDACVGRKKDWNNYNNECPLIHNYSAPTFEVAQRWLREVKNIDINILAESISGNKQYIILGIWFNISDVNASPVVLDTVRYKSYEDAQEAGIKKALEILLEK